MSKSERQKHLMVDEGFHTRMKSKASARKMTLKDAVQQAGELWMETTDESIAGIVADGGLGPS